MGSNGNERIRNAVENAKLLEQYWKDKGKDMEKDIVEMNPAVNIKKLEAALWESADLLRAGSKLTSNQGCIDF